MRRIALRLGVLSCVVALTGLVPVAADEQPPATTRGASFDVTSAVQVTPQAMLESLPRQFVPSDGKDGVQVDAAAKWITQQYVGHGVTLTGAGDATVEFAGGDQNPLRFSIHSFRATRWAEMFVTTSFDGDVLVTDAVAKQMQTRGHGIAAIVRLRLKSVEFECADARHLRMVIKGKMVGYTIR